MPLYSFIILQFEYNNQMSEQKKIQVKQYISEHINIFIEPLVYNIVKSKPSNPIKYSIKWLQDYLAKQQKEHASDSDSEEEKEDIAALDVKIQKKKLQGKSRSRMAISEEVFGNFNKRQSKEISYVPKNQQTQLLIKSLIENSILFQNMDSKDSELLIKSMSERQFQVGDVVIEQGERGNQLFIVSSGQYECFKWINGDQQYLKTYSSGQAFGQLSLMYNAPRAATIKCSSAGKVYTLDRIVFSQITKQATMKKRQLYKNILEKIEVFSSIDEFQREQFLDILKEEKYEPGQYIIKQGEQGNKFYIILEGQLAALKTQEHQELPKIVYNYREGDYFGQLALTHDVCRQASVKAVSAVRVAYLDRESFKRIFGSMQQMLKRNEIRYSTPQIVCQ